MARRYYTRRAQVPGARVAFAKGRGYYAPEPGQGVLKAAPIPLSTNAVLEMLRGRLLSPAEEGRQARVTAQQAIAESVGQLRASARAAQAQAAAKAQVAEQFGLKLAEMGTADADAIRQAYQQAAVQTGALGAGLTGAAREAQAQSVAQSNAVLQQLGQQQIAAPAEGGSNVTAYLGGVLPAATLEGAGAASYANALAQRRAQAGQLAGVQQQFLGQSIQTQRELASQVAQLQAQRPKLVREARESLAGQSRQDLATLLTGLQLQGEQWSDAAQVQQNQAELAAKVAADRARTATDKAKARTSAYAAQGLAPDGRSPLPGYYRDRIGVVRKIPTGMMVGEGGQLVPVPKRGAAGAGRALSVSDLRRTRESLFDVGRQKLGLAVGSTRPYVNWTLKQVRDFLWNQGGRDLTAVYGDRPAIRGMVNAVATSLYNEYAGKGGGQRPRGGATGTPATANPFGTLYG